MWKAIQEFQREKKLSNTNWQLDLQTMQALSGVETTVEDNHDATAGNSGATPASSGSSSDTSTERKPVTPSSKNKPAKAERTPATTPATTPKPPKYRSKEWYDANDPEHVTDYGFRSVKCPNKVSLGIPSWKPVYKKWNDGYFYYKQGDKFYGVNPSAPYYRIKLNYAWRPENKEINLCKSWERALSKLAKMKRSDSYVALAKLSNGMQCYEYHRGNVYKMVFDDDIAKLLKKQDLIWFYGDEE